MPKSVVKCKWRISNKVSKDWPSHVKMVANDKRFKYEFPVITSPLRSGQVADISVRILIPENIPDETRHIIGFNVINKKGTKIGETMYAMIELSEVEFIKSNFQKLGTAYEYYNNLATNNKKIYKDVMINSEMSITNEDVDDLQSLKL